MYKKHMAMPAQGSMNEMTSLTSRPALSKLETCRFHVLLLSINPEMEYKLKLPSVHVEITYWTVSY